LARLLFVEVIYLAKELPIVEGPVGKGRFKASKVS